MASASSARARTVHDSPGAVYERTLVAAGRLPDRYAEPWFEPFAERAGRALRPGVTILDVGSGRAPAIDVEDRPSACVYVGLDVSAGELSLAPEHAYDEMIYADIVEPDASLQGRFDLIVSWQVLEHVKPLPAAVATMHGYLRPGGRLVAQVSGGLSAFALAGRLLPHSVSKRLMSRLLGVDPQETFPTHYDRCRYRALQRIFSDWSEHEVIPRYKGAAYFRFAPSLEAAYTRYENWICERQIADLATHYLIDAVR